MWHLAELPQIIANGESETVEFKKSTSLIREAVETACAFANQRGGYLIFGITDSGKVDGVQSSDDTLRNIANEIKLNTNPKLYPSVEKVFIEGENCILVTVEESPLKPHLAYGRPFLRVGPTNQRMDRQQYETMLQQRLNGYGFDHQIQIGAGLNDIDTETLYRFLETSNSVRSFNESLLLPPEILLEKLGLAKKEQITRAAILLFGLRPDNFFEGFFEVKGGTFLADEGYDQILNDKEFHSNLMNIFEGVFGYVMEAIKKDSKKEGVYRTETPEFPVSVIREAIVNMIVHRDYRQGIKGTVEIRPSRVTFSNPGQLFGPTITVDRLKKPHPSRPGNHLIAKVFYLTGLFENWGSGTLKIIDETIKFGKQEPRFSYEDGIFRVELLR